MAIYRADRRHGICWITGGSTGIGRQLALDLAREGWTVAVTSRVEDPIEPVIQAAAGLSGKILPFYCDVTDEAGMAATVEAIETQAGPIVLAIFNAGVYLPIHAEALSMANFRRTYEVNMFGVLNGLVPTVARMQTRTRGHIVLVGSVTAYFGWPTLAAYGATKAALNNMAEALRYDFEKMNIRIQIINPGFVDTPARRQEHTSDALPHARRGRCGSHGKGDKEGRLRDHLPAPADMGAEVHAHVAAGRHFRLHELCRAVARLSPDAGQEARVTRYCAVGFGSPSPSCAGAPSIRVSSTLADVISVGGIFVRSLSSTTTSARLPAVSVPNSASSKAA